MPELGFDPSPSSGRAGPPSFGPGNQRGAGFGMPNSPRKPGLSDWLWFVDTARVWLLEDEEEHPTATAMMSAVGQRLWLLMRAH